MQLSFNVDANNYLQSFQQRQHPNPTVNLLNTALSILAGSQAPSAQLMGYSSSSSQSSAMHSLMSLYGMTVPQPTLLNSNTSAPMSQLLVLAMQRVVEEELQRRAQADANFAIVTTIQWILGQGCVPNNSIVQTQQGILPPSRQTLGSNNNDTVQPQQVGAPPPSAGNLNIQACSMAAILQAARRGEAAGQSEDGDAHTQNGPDDNGNVNGDNNDDDHEGRPLSPGKRKSRDDDQYDDTNDDSWNERLRPRKKLHRK